MSIGVNFLFVKIIFEKKGLILNLKLVRLSGNFLTRIKKKGTNNQKDNHKY